MTENPQNTLDYTNCKRGHADAECPDKKESELQNSSADFCAEILTNPELQKEITEKARDVVIANIRTVLDAIATDPEFSKYEKELEERYAAAVERIKAVQPEFLRERLKNLENLEHLEPDSTGVFNLQTRRLRISIDSALANDPKAKSKTFASLTHELTHAAEAWHNRHLKIGNRDKTHKTLMAWINSVLPDMLWEISMSHTNRQSEQFGNMLKAAGQDIKNKIQTDIFFLQKTILWREYLVESLNIAGLNRVIQQGEGGQFLAENDFSPDVSDLPYEELERKEEELMGLRGYRHLLAFIERSIKDREKERHGAAKEYQDVAMIAQAGMLFGTNNPDSLEFGRVDGLEKTLHRKLREKIDTLGLPDFLSLLFVLK